MDGVDILAKLNELKRHLDKLTEDDGAFVSEMVRLHESGQIA